MSVELQFQFIGGKRGIAFLHYDHFMHHVKGRWNSPSPFIGRPNGAGLQSSGTFEMAGGVLSMYEKDEQGRDALAVELRYYPKLGGMHKYEIESRKFEGPFRIYRAQINDANNGTWHILRELSGSSGCSGKGASSKGASEIQPTLPTVKSPRPGRLG